MLKNWKCIVSMLMVAVVIVGLIVPSTKLDAASSQGISLQDLVAPAEDASYSVRGIHVPDSLSQTLKEYDVNIGLNTLIEVRPMDDDSCGNALVITNVTSNQVVKDVIIDVDKNGEILPINVNVDNGVSVLGGTTVEYPDNKAFSIKATAVYNQRPYQNTLYSYYQPVGSYFFLYDDGNSGVSYIETEYICYGFEYTYPGYVLANENPYTHTIFVKKSSPSKNTMYHAYDEYNTSRVIWTGSGAEGCGQYLFVRYRINGGTLHESFQFKL